MGRKANRRHGVKAARAERLLNQKFAGLQDAMTAWLDDDDYVAVECELDRLASEEQEEFERELSEAPVGQLMRTYPTVGSGMARDELVSVLTERFLLETRIAERLDHLISLVREKREYTRSELIAAVAMPRNVPEYMAKLVSRMQAEGLKQPDVHPSSRALAKYLVEAVHSFNRQRRGQTGDWGEDYNDQPVNDWAELPRSFAGFKIVDIDQEESQDLDPCPLPPSTDIAYFTSDHAEPPKQKSQFETYKASERIVADWSDRTGRGLPRAHGYIWAFLLAHRLSEDMSDVSYYDGREFQSPWNEGQVVRIEADPDDVPY